MKKVILLAGPGGSGKSTIAELIEKKCGYIMIDGDHEDSEFFPDGGQWLPDNSDRLAQAHDKILNKVQDLVKKGENVIVDYIIFGRYLEYFEKFKKVFSDDLQIAILFPSESQTVKRDLERECWTTGVNRIKSVRCELEKIRDEVGSENFIDTSGQTADETFNTYFKC